LAVDELIVDKNSRLRCGAHAIDSNPESRWIWLCHADFAEECELIYERVEIEIDRIIEDVRMLDQEQLVGREQVQVVLPLSAANRPRR
jgi:hypothetical protein